MVMLLMTLGDPCLLQTTPIFYILCCLSCLLDGGWTGNFKFGIGRLIITSLSLWTINRPKGRRHVTWPIVTARRYASVVYAVVVCLSVRPSVRHTPVLCQNG